MGDLKQGHHPLLEPLKNLARMGDLIHGLTPLLAPLKNEIPHMVTPHGPHGSSIFISNNMSASKARNFSEANSQMTGKRKCPFKIQALWLFNTQLCLKACLNLVGLLHGLTVH